MNTIETDFFCNLSALSKREREQFPSLTEALFASVQETRELEKGFAFRFRNQPEQLVQVAKFIERESRCCPFLGFTLEVEPSAGPVWLNVTGPGGVKPFLLAELEQIQLAEQE